MTTWNTGQCRIVYSAPRVASCLHSLVLCAWKVRLPAAKLANCNEVNSQRPHRAQITRASCLKNPGERNAVCMLAQNAYNTHCNLVLLLRTGGATRDCF